LCSDICNIPKDRTITYAWNVIDHHPQREDPNRVCITVGGNLIGYPFELIMQTANMVSSKILWNSVISTKDACFAGADIINMYLETPLDSYEYMKMPIALLPTPLDQYEYMKMPIALLPTNKFNITTSIRKPSMDMFTWKYKRKCTDYHRLVS
jgi:hypothetical protein